MGKWIRLCMLAIVLPTLAEWSGLAMAATPQVAGGRGFTLALNANGELRSWGSNYFGELGDGTLLQRTQPQLIGTGYSQIRASGASVFALKEDGSLWAWGSNLNGQLGVGSSDYDLAVPTPVGTLFKEVTAGFACHFGIKADQTLWGWGANAHGELGDGGNADRSSPVQIAEDFVAVVSGSGENTADNPIICYTLALKSNGDLWAWGGNAHGQLGDGTTGPRSMPTLIGSGFREIKVGGNASYGIKQDGTLWSWGANNYGQLGDGGMTQRNTPGLVATDVQALFPVGASVFAIKTDGSLWAWGNNAQGQLGDGSTEMRTTPVRIGQGFTHIARLTDWSVYGLQADGSLWAWGSNTEGEFGDGTTTSYSVPTRIGTGFHSITGLPGWAGSYTIAMKTDGSLWGWGDNTSGNLGDGSTEWRLTPVAILSEGFAISGDSSVPVDPEPPLDSAAAFDGATGVLDLPRVELGDAAYRVKLQLVDAELLSLRVTTVDAAVHGHDANTVTVDGDMNVSIPRLRLEDQAYWFALRLIDAGNLTFQVAGFGVLTGNRPAGQQ